MGGGMKILSREEIDPETWNVFCDSHPGAWWWWRSEYLDYQIARGSKDLSFGILDADRLVAICPLMLEEKTVCEMHPDGEGASHWQERSFTMEGYPGPWPKHENTRTGRFVLQQVESLAREHRVSHLAWRQSPFEATRVSAGIVEIIDEKMSSVPCLTGISWHTQVLDLTQSEADLHAGLRKSYQALINAANRSHEIVADSTGMLMEPFRLLHREKSGRETRPKATWDMQVEWCRQGNGLVVAAKLGGVWDAFSYWVIYKNCAYYGSSTAVSRNIMHACVWRAMLELKARGVESLEMGWIDYDMSEKGLGISAFKRGFGGEAVPVIAVERRFDANRA